MLRFLTERDRADGAGWGPQTQSRTQKKMPCATVKMRNSVKARLRGPLYSILAGVEGAG
jgi:hypothetical protein